MNRALDDARVRILVENTAQAVFKHLERLEDVRDKLGTRWVWELLQNARDVATTNGVAVEIVVSENTLEFRHDGRSFTEDEIAHLIYHGSTKVTEDDSDLVHFGSGFLSTHLLSRYVTVRGRLDSGQERRRFVFSLDRSGGSVEELNQSMQATWEQFAGSLEDRTLPESEGQTSFSYVLDETGLELAIAGLEQLKEFVALTLAFSPEIRAVSVCTPSDFWNAQRGECLHRDGILLHQFDVHFQDDGATRAVAVAGDESVQAALPLRPNGNGTFSIDLDSETPRVFVVFPLLTTERLALPTIVQSTELAPQEDRDGLPLVGDSDRSINNRRLIEQSAPFAKWLIDRAALEGWQGADEILRFHIDSIPDWAHEEWLYGQLRGLLDYSRAKSLLVTASGTRIAARDALISAGTADAIREELWELAYMRLNGDSLLPARDSLNSWADNLSSWLSLLGDKAELPEVLDVQYLASFAADRTTVATIETELEHGDVMDWLARLAELVLFQGSSEVFDSMAILPSEAGHLHKRSDLELDGGIDNDLKEIGEQFEVHLRDRLLVPDLAEGTLAGLFATLTESVALEDVLGRHSAIGREGTMPSTHLQASGALFTWLTNSSEHRDRIEGFQASSTDGVGDGFALIPLERYADHPPLAPAGVWNEGARKFEELFPRRRVLHKTFLGDSSGVPDWEWLSRYGFLALDPIIRRKRSLSVFVSSGEIVEPEDDDDAHRALEAVELSDIAFLDEPDIGLIDGARRSKTRAQELLRLVLFYVARVDVTAFDEVAIPCQCGDSHLAFRAGWLAPLRRRKWIPSSDGTRRSLNVSAETLADLVRNAPDIVEGLATNIGDKLLRAWGISPSDFQLRVVAEDEETRKSLVLAVGELTRASGSVERFQSLAREIAGHPELISQIEYQRQQREEVERNAQIGEMVETLLQEQLSSEGFKVKRTGIGSDFELERDLLADDGDVVIEVSSSQGSALIEIKSTRRSYVRLTPRQAETATAEFDRFCLCVVELVDDIPTAPTVLAGCRFVFDIGSRISSAWTDYQRYEAAALDVRRPRGEIDVDIDEGQVRFRVNQEVWAHALDFAAAIQRFRLG